MFFAYTPEEKKDIPCATQLPGLSQPAPWEGTWDLDMNTALLGREQQWQPATSKYTFGKTAASGHPSKAKLFS